MKQIIGLVQVIAALGDYIFKAVGAYRSTPEGQAEFQDIVAAYERATGDEAGEAAAVQQAQTLRSRKPTGERVVNLMDQ